jgi:hypothetical protein
MKFQEKNEKRTKLYRTGEVYKLLRLSTVEKENVILQIKPKFLNLEKM